jgi:gluconokinase
VFVHLRGERDVLAARVAARPAHFMPAALVDSQFETLEPLQPDELGDAVDVAQSVDQIVEQALTVLSTRTKGETSA